MKIKQLSALLLAVSMAAVQPVIAMEVEEDTVEVSIRDIDQPQQDVSGKPMRNAAKKQRKDKTKDVKAKAGNSKKKTKSTKAKGAKGKSTTRDKNAKKSKKDVTVAKLGKFNRKGEIKSFTGAVENMIAFMSEHATNATASQKAELFTIIARFNWITGRKGFDTPAHKAQTIKLLESAKAHSSLFGVAKSKFINKWLTAQQAQLMSSSKKMKQTKSDKLSKKNRDTKKSASARSKMRRAEMQKDSTRTVAAE
jgi:hypothetical protein